MRPVGRITTLACPIPVDEYQLTATDGIMIVGKQNLTIRSQSGNREAVVIRGEGISDTSIWFNFKLYNSNYIAIEDMT